jgi:hypothetical protein
LEELPARGPVGRGRERRAFWRYWEERGEVGEEPSDLVVGIGIGGGRDDDFESDFCFDFLTLDFSFGARVRAWCFSGGRKERSWSSGVEVERERLGLRSKLSGIERGFETT